MMADRIAAPRGIRAPALSLWLLLAAFASGCQDEAVQLASEIQAARGECTPELLRASDEECVRMMEKYAGMTADLIDTYIGGVRSLDIALDRMPPMEFDTAGLGYAISPEYHAGDPLGPGASPRLWPALNREESLISSSPRHLRRPGRGRPGLPMSDRDAYVRGGGATGSVPRAGGAGIDERFRYSGYGWGRMPYSPGFRYDIFESGPFGYFSDPWGGYGYAPYGYGYGYDRSPSGYGRPGYSGAYDRGRYPGGYFDGYDGVPGAYFDGYNRVPGAYFDGYDQYPGAYFDGYDRYPGAYLDRYEPYASGYLDTGSRYAPPDGHYRDGGEPLYDRAYAVPYQYRPPYGDGRDGYYQRGQAPDADVRSPAEDWGYAPGSGVGGEPLDAEAQPSTEPPVGAAPAGPPRHRPGILLPPEERLRRPWLED